MSRTALRMAISRPAAGPRPIVFPAIAAPAVVLLSIVFLSTASVSFVVPRPVLASQDTHLDLSVVEGGCSSCHASHGAGRSPMLPGPQTGVCLLCHSTQNVVDFQVSRGSLAPGSRPPLLAQVLSRPFSHPLTPGAFSRREPGAVTCTSCHTPHRSARSVASVGQRRLSTRDPARFEYELCQRCHGSGGTGTQSFLDLSRLTNPNNRSYHPIEAPARESSPSVRSDLGGLEINCTDCHGNSDPAGPRGPHGSEFRFLLSQRYATVDGSAESPDAYALCYSCHDRERVLDASSPFPLHGAHVVDERTSCVTCHSAHGSVDHRGLIRFGEETYVAGVTASISTGRLEFISEMAGSGTCFLTCHGADHGPKSYGFAEATELFRDFPRY